MWEQMITAMSTVVRDKTQSLLGSNMFQQFNFFSVKLLTSEIEARFAEMLCGYRDTS